MDEEEFLREEILEIGRQESRNFRTVVILSGLLVSSLSFISKGSTEQFSAILNSAAFMTSVGLLLSSIVLSYGISVFRWSIQNLDEAEIDELREYTSIQRRLLLVARAFLILSVPVALLGMLQAFSENLRYTILSPMFLLLVSAGILWWANQRLTK
jgi:glucan phosphoethanolaminetransferase (alkaline phosphatase superfamily)